ncbi:DUF3179 domain-containing protein [Phaeobacter sp. LSS9]|uniref:DUF3179 domain-containing protein n=1 Tax=unclassified Phaeobacter TaxID=2621772 RepID=UPI000E54C07D|nr:DUF3179 domain-containing protein [Phaeobacter sp. LSS9]AXT34332.1 DUF3179 domain-containing protein [Phaeobacter sp. LSS9]
MSQMTATHTFFLQNKAVAGLSLLLMLSWLAVAHADPAIWAREWPVTDFTRSSVADWAEIKSGGPPKDGIPALSDPAFHPARQAKELSRAEPVVVLDLPGQAARAYPLRYLIWHEIVNDGVGGTPVAVTYCPLCNSAMSFDRRVAGRSLSFGVTGKLRQSDMVMYDRETESWWQQATGTGIVGEMNGRALRQLPSWLDSWQGFRAAYPEGLVMAEPRHNRSYGRNPYQGYDRSNWPFLYDGTPPPHGIAPLARVVRVGDRAWPLARLAKVGEIREAGVTLSWRSGQASALDAGHVGKGRDVGSVRVRGRDGADLPHDVMFAFAYHAFWPKGRWMLE